MYKKEFFELKKEQINLKKARANKEALIKDQEAINYFLKGIAKKRIYLITKTQIDYFKSLLTQDLIELVKALLTLQFYIKENKDKKQVAVTKSITYQNIDDIDYNLPVTRCNVHGVRYIDQCVKAGYALSGKFRFKCRECQHMAQYRHYKNNKDTILIKCAEYKAKKRLKNEEK